MKNYLNTSLFVLFAFLLCSCVKEYNENAKLSTNAGFEPCVEISVRNKMLIFNSKEALDMFLTQVNSSNQDDVDKWEEKIGFVSHRLIFKKVIEKEDSVNDFYENLPEKEQEFWKKQPEIHSDFYYEALDNGWIREVVEPDGNVYFDYNLVDNSMNSVVNCEGLVYVEGKIFQYTSNALKIITNGDFDLVLSLASVNSSNPEGTILVDIKKDEVLQKSNGGVYPGYNWSQTSSSPYITITNLPDDHDYYGDWLCWDYKAIGGYKKRCKVWIDGHSQRYGTDNTPDCNSAVSCTFTIRAEYMEKNIWGNWKYNGMLSLSLEADWDYSYGKYQDVTQGCGVSPITYHSVSQYNCGGTVNCPTSPFSKNYPSANNTFINLTPHSTGYWYASGPWFSNAFNVDHLSLTAKFGNITFSYNW